MMIQNVTVSFALFVVKGSPRPVTPSKMQSLTIQGHNITSPGKAPQQILTTSTGQTLIALNQLGALGKKRGQGAR